jgi:hypothetical protein
MDNPALPNQPAPLSKEETEALNRHGVFFKKRVLLELGSVDGIGIVCEELGVSFGGTRVIGLFALDKRESPHVFFVFECKRAYAADKRWIFFRDWDQRYRVLREQSGMVGHTSVFTLSVPPHLVVCSEGYEYSKQDNKADQNPVFKASGQLSAAYRGLLDRRHREFRSPRQPDGKVERYVPVLVTTAELLLVQKDLGAISLDSGNVAIPPGATAVDSLILKHPFPTPEGVTHDFRDNQNPTPSPPFWSQLQKESIYVVRASALRPFLAEDRRNYLRVAKSQD